MRACPHAIDVEDLVLGLLGEDDAARIETHSETCVECTETRSLFVAERAIFALRTEVAPAPPPFVEPRPSLLRFVRPSRVLSGVVGIAAGIAALVARMPIAPHDDCAPPVAIASSSSDDEVLICTAPVSAVSAMALASHEPAPLACVPSPSATCDVPSWMSVTSSVAAP